MLVRCKPFIFDVLKPFLIVFVLGISNTLLLNSEVFHHNLLETLSRLVVQKVSYVSGQDGTTLLRVSHILTVWQKSLNAHYSYYAVMVVDKGVPLK